MEWFAYFKTFSSYSIFNTPSLLGKHEGLPGWQAFTWLYEAPLEVREWLLPELVLGAWFLALESFLPCPRVYMLGPVASDLLRHTSLIWPWAGSLEGVVSLTISRAVDLSGRLWFTSFPRPVGFTTIIVSLCYLQLQFCAVLSSSPMSIF